MRRQRRCTSHQQFSTVCVKAPAPKLVGSHLPAPVSQAYQEQTVVGETTRSIVGSIFVVEEQIGTFLFPT